MPSPSEVANFQKLLANLAALAVRRVSGLVSQDPAALPEIYPATIDPFIAAAGQLSAEWYRSLDPASEYVAETAPPPPVEALQKNAWWASTQPDVGGALGGSAERQVFKTSRDTVAHNAQREGVKYARYASANACPWCRVLATRGPVYHTADNAVRGHDNCHCVAVPLRGGDTYSPPDYVKQWVQDYEDARAQVGGDLDDIVNYLRRTAARSKALSPVAAQ